jgi:hypothetical protein
MRMYRVAVVALLAAAPAWADHIADTTSELTDVRITLAGTTARIHARFAVDVPGPGAGFNAHSITIPPRSVVTGGVALAGGKRHKLRLDTAVAANRALDALMLKPGRGADRSSMIVLHGDGTTINVDVLSPRAAKLTLELTLDAATCFYNDHRFVELPVSWSQRLPAAQREHAREHLDEECDGTLVEDDSPVWIGLTSNHLARQPPGASRVGAIAGRLPLGDNHVARVEIDIARVLSEVPRDLHTAIVIDHSHSMSTGELEAQRAIVAAYLRAAPTSRVQVIGYARHAEALLPAWMVASQAAPRVDRAIRALPPRNGSNLDTALIEAAAWLGRVKGTKRIVLFSDERLAARLSSEPAALRELVSSDTLIHAVWPSPDAKLERRDLLLSALAAATEGIQVFGGPDEHGGLDATSLVRPTELTKLELAAKGWEPFHAGERDCLDDDTLREGRSCTWWAQGDGVAGPITITGLLWGKPFKRVVAADPTQARELARVLSLADHVDATLKEQAEKLAFAVNSVWSLIARWGGRGGYEDLGGFGTIGGRRFGTIGRHRSHGIPVPPRVTRVLDLRDQLRPAIAKCKRTTSLIEIHVETTLNEIVALGVRVTPADPTLQVCIVEAVWDTTLLIPNAPLHATSRVAFGNKP